MSGTAANLPVRVTLEGADATESVLRRIADQVTTTFVATSQAAQTTAPGVTRVAEAFGVLEQRVQGGRRALGDLSGALELLGSSGAAGSLGSVASYAGNLADLFGTLSLGAGRMEAAAGALSGRLAAIAGLVALPVLLQSVGLGISTAGDAAITATQQTQSYEAALEQLARTAGGTTQQLRALAEAQRVAQLNTAITNGEIALGRELDTRSQLPAQFTAASQSLAEAERDLQRARTRASEGSPAAAAAIASREAAVAQARARLDQLRALEDQTEGRINTLSVERSLAILRRDNPPPIEVDVPGTRPGGGGGGGAAQDTVEQQFAAAEARARQAAERVLQTAQRATDAIERRSVDAFARIGESALDRIGNSLVDAFVKGEGAALDFGNLAKGVLASVLADLLKLGAINPLTNSLFGTARPTLDGALSGGGAGGGGILASIGLPNGLGTELWDGASIGGLLGGSALGFGAGALLSSFTASSAARQQNGLFGSGAGALAGAAIGSIIPGIGPVIGGLVGGAAGGGLGGLIGPGAGFSGGDAVLGLDESGLLTVDRTVGKRFDTAGLSANANAQVAALNQQLRAAGLAFRGGIGDTRIGGGGSTFATNLADSIRNSGALGALRANDSRIQGAIDRGGATDLNGILAIAQQAQAFVGVLEGLKPASDDPIEQIKAQFQGLFDSARQLGFGLDEVTAAQARAIAALDEAQRRQAAGSAAGVLDGLGDYARSLRTANDNSSNPLDRFGVARSQFQADAAAAARGDPAALRRLQSSAEAYRGNARNVYGSGFGFAGVEGEITNVLDQVGNLGQDLLTASFQAEITRTQTDTLVGALGRLQDEVAALRREAQQRSAAPFPASA